MSWHLDLELLIGEGAIHPRMERKDVGALLPAPEQRDDDMPPDEGGAPAPDEAAEPDDSEPNPITAVWTNANDKVRREFVSAFWAEIKRLRDGAALNGNGADPEASASAMMARLAQDADRWIESDK
jgi:hypothetical protein